MAFLISPYFTLPFQAFREALEALPALMFIMLVMAYGFAALLYLLEPRENMPTIAHAAWLVISTITTVGTLDCWGLLDRCGNGISNGMPWQRGVSTSVFLGRVRIFT